MSDRLLEWAQAFKARDRRRHHAAWKKLTDRERLQVEAAARVRGEVSTFADEVLEAKP